MDERDAESDEVLREAARTIESAAQRFRDDAALRGVWGSQQPESDRPCLVAGGGVCEERALEEQIRTLRVETPELDPGTEAVLRRRLIEGDSS